MSANAAFIAISAAFLQLILGIAFAVIAIYLALMVLDHLTKGINEFQEIAKGNVAVALEMAGQLKKEHSGSITAVTMGPKISEEVLWEALALGADRAVLLSDPRFSSSDTLATSYVLGMGIRKIGRFDLILCGMRTTDGDTGQVGPQLAEELDVEMPIAGQVFRVLFKGLDVRKAVSELMVRELKHELAGIEGKS
jgi:electron transfer flavoprotein alpha/beta subunit